MKPSLLFLASLGRGPSRSRGYSKPKCLMVHMESLALKSFHNSAVDEGTGEKPQGGMKHTGRKAVCGAFKPVTYNSRGDYGVMDECLIRTGRMEGLRSEDC